MPASNVNLATPSYTKRTRIPVNLALREEKPTPYHQKPNVSPARGLTIEELTKDPYKINYLYHITHVDNLLSILKSGLLSHRRAHGGNLVIEDIADQEVINIRRWKRIPITGRRLVDYVPLFFTPRNPMLYVRKELQDNIAILCLDSSLLFQKGVVFTDGNAASKDTDFFDDLRFISNLDWKCIRTDYWADFEDGTRKRSAEVLVPHSIPSADVQRIILRTKDTEHKLHSKLRARAEVKPRWYFDD